MSNGDRGPKEPKTKGGTRAVQVGIEGTKFNGRETKLIASEEKGRFGIYKGDLGFVYVRF